MVTFLLVTGSVAGVSRRGAAGRAAAGGGCGRCRVHPDGRCGGPVPWPLLWEQQSALCCLRGPEPLGAGVLEGRVREQPPLPATPQHPSCVVPFAGALPVGTEPPGHRWEQGRNGLEGSSNGPCSPRGEHPASTEQSGLWVKPHFVGEESALTLLIVKSF